MIDETKRMKEALIISVTRYMIFGGAESDNDPDYDPEFDAGYTQEDIDACESILDHFIAKIASIDAQRRDERIMDAVKAVVLGLNEINEACDGCLIETDQREQICEIIISSARKAGLVSSLHDITEEWREW